MAQHLRTFGQIATVALALSSATLVHAEVIDSADPWVNRAGSSHTTIVGAGR